jgi:ketol-acid reductoisomerase
MKKTLTEIQNGEFARNWLMENALNRPNFNSIKRNELEHPIVEVGKELRSMMTWIKG